MLTATYSLVAMATEQKNASHLLARARQAIAALWNSRQEADLGRAEEALSGLTRFDHYCHQRKVEKYVIPTVRGASREIDAIVGELESLSGIGMKFMGTAAEQLRAMFERHGPQVPELCHAMEAYCDCLQQRLKREEEDLLPLVRRMLSVDDWFSLAAKFLGDEQSRKPTRNSAPQGTPALA